VPDITVAAVLLDALDNRLDRVNLVRAHDQQFLFAGQQHHIAAEHLAQGAFGKKLLRKRVKVGNFAVVRRGKLIHRQKALVGIETEMAGIVVGKIPGVAAVADDKKLDETQQGIAVAVAGVVLVFDNLFNRATRADGQGFQFNLHHRHAVDEQDDVVTVVAAAGIDAQLADDFKIVFAPVAQVDQGVMERAAVVALETVDVAQGVGGVVDIGVDDPSSRRWNSASLNCTRLSASNFSRKLASSAARLRMSGRRVYLRSASLAMSCCSMWRSSMGVSVRRFVNGAARCAQPS